MDKILANVNGTPIKDSDINEFLAGLRQRGAAYNNPEGRKVILNQIIGDKLMLLDAKKNLIEAEPAFKAELARMKDRLLVGYAVEKLISTVIVSDKETEEYYNENKEQFKSPETVNASHILVDSEEMALKILSEIKEGKKSFEDAAREYSSCPSGKEGGCLGDFGRGQMVPEFDTAVFSMNVGEITDLPVKTQFGFHLIKLNTKNESAVPAFEEIKDGIKDGLLGEKRKKAYDSKINQLKILYPVDMML